MADDSFRHPLHELNKDYARLREDSEAWEQFLCERAAWEGTLLDGIDALP